MKGYKLIRIFSIFCVLFSMVVGILILLTHKTSTETMTFMLLFLFVGLLGGYTANALKEYEIRLEKLERNIKKEE